MAFIWEGEPGDVRTYSYHALDREVSKFSNVLKAMGANFGGITLKERKSSLGMSGYEFAMMGAKLVNFLKSGNIDDQVQRNALNLLGRIYTRLNEHDSAAMAYAGLFAKMGGSAQ